MADLIPTMTSGTEPSGYCEASSSDISHVPYRAFDDDGSTWWSTTAAGVKPCWLKYSWQFGSPQARSKIVVSYTVTARSGAANQDGAPKAWTFEGYRNATEGWVTLDTQAAQTAWGEGEKRTFSFSNTTPYVYYRIYITDNNGGTYTEIAELEMIGGPAKIMAELAGVHVLCKHPVAQVELAGVHVLCKQPMVQMLLAGVNILWYKPEGNMLLSFHF